MGYGVCLAVFTLFWLTIGFGIIDLTSGFAFRSTDADGNEVLSAACGVIAAIVLPAAFLVQLRAAFPSVAALQQVLAVAVAFAGVLALDPLSFISVATLAVMLAILWRLSPERLPSRWSSSCWDCSRPRRPEAGACRRSAPRPRRLSSASSPS